MFLFSFFFCISSRIFAQLDVNIGYTDLELAETLVGEGIEIVSVTSDCYSQAFGKFNCIDCNLGIDSGIVMTSGKAINAEGPNNSGATGFDNGWSDDADLEALPGVGAIFDACVLEMDIIPNFDTIRFYYVFGSDEYLEWVDFANDAFAFWISGPGIVGDQNIALIPGTTTAVTINNVNNVDYSAYYINNPSSGAALTDPYYIDYDGFTVVLEAFHEVTPCETYHLKLAVGDQLDGSWDSGVFLKANSLTTNYIATYTYPGGGFGTAAEFCTTGTDPSPELDPDATSGVWSATPSGLDIDSISGAIDLSDSEPGSYTVSNMVIYGYCEFDTIIATTEVIITEPPIATFSYLGSPYCASASDPSPILGAGAEGGTFSSSPAGCVINSATGIIDISASSAGTYTITNTIAASGGCPAVSATTSITIIDSYDISLSEEICSGDSYTLPDGDVVTVSGIYIAELVTAGGCDSIITTSLIVNPVYDYGVDAEICDGDIYYLPDGAAVTDADVYVSNLITDAGCDSIITTTLSVIPLGYSSANAEICSGDFFELPDGVFVSSAGTYTSTISAASGCDSIITTELIVHPVYSVPQSISICSGSSYVLPDGAIAYGAGIYYSYFYSVYGCDSTIITTINESDVIYDSVDVEICEGDEYELPDGVVVNSAGVYVSSYTTITGCDSIITTTLIVNPNPIISFIPDNILCIEIGTYPLNASPAGGTFSGDFVSAGAFNTASAGVGGPYEIIYNYTDANGCSASATAYVNVDANFAEAFGDTTLIEGDTVTIYGNSGGSYLWSPESYVACAVCASTEIWPPQTTTYTFSSVNENGCIASDAVYIYVLPDPGNAYFIPNAFSPNGDGLNDYFFAFAPNLLRIKSMHIFDRWGEMIFEKENITASDIEQGWDGTKYHVSLNSGVFAYEIELEFTDGEIIFAKGNITILK